MIYKDYDCLLYKERSQRNYRVQALLIFYIEIVKMYCTLLKAGDENYMRRTKVNKYPGLASLEEGVEYLDHVDKDDTVIGVIRRDIAHQRGYRHRASHVFIFQDADLEIMLISKRSNSKKLGGGKLHSPVSGHVLAGQTYVDTAYKEAGEEQFRGMSFHRGTTPLGFALRKELRCYNDNYQYNKENVTLFIAVYPGPFSFDPAEVMENLWMQCNDVWREINSPRTRDNYSPDFQKVMSAYMHPENAHK